MSTWIWALVLVAAIWAAHWGAERLAHPLKKLRRQWGFTAAAGGSFIGLAAASPEIGINVASAFRGVADIGLGTAIGSNVLAIPLVVTVAYVASRRERLGGGKPKERGERSDGKPEEDRAQPAQSNRRDSANADGRSRSDDDDGESPEAHQRHLEGHLLRIRKRAVTVQALPYLGILVLFAALSLPAPWRGLQPLDGALLLGAYLAYAAQALLRGRKEGEGVEWTKKEIMLALAGLAVLALGAYLTVRSTENIVEALGIQQVVGGLFITAPMAALPEVFAVWAVTRSGQITSATTSVIGDHAVTMTVAFLPLALIGLPVDDFPIFATTLAFVALVPIAYAAMIHWGSKEHGFKLWQVLALDGIYLAYVAVMVFGILNVL